VATALFQGFRRNNFPFTVIEIHGASIWSEIKSVIRPATGLEVRANVSVGDFKDLCVAISPLSVKVSRPIGRTQVYNCVGRDRTRSLLTSGVGDNSIEGGDDEECGDRGTAFRVHIHFR
jgi:hypothetical protein